jgi:hypothetical protein
MGSILLGCLATREALPALDLVEGGVIGNASSSKLNTGGERGSSNQENETSGRGTLRRCPRRLFNGVGSTGGGPGLNAVKKGRLCMGEDGDTGETIVGEEPVGEGERFRMVGPDNPLRLKRCTGLVEAAADGTGLSARKPGGAP